MVFAGVKSDYENVVILDNGNGEHTDPMNYL